VTAIEQPDLIQNANELMLKIEIETRKFWEKSKKARSLGGVDTYAR